MTLHAFTDGASRGNPGESGIGVVLKDEQGNALTAVGGYIGTATNNVAEYTALLACIRLAANYPCRRLVVHSDSELMVRQLTGKYKIKDATLKQHAQRVRGALKEAPFAFELRHVPREQNREADELANQGIDSRVPLAL